MHRGERSKGEAEIVFFDKGFGLGKKEEEMGLSGRARLGMLLLSPF